MPTQLRPLLLGILLLAAASLTGAYPPDRKEIGDKKDAAPNYYPLQVGNQWKFRVTVAGKTASAVSTIAKIENIDGVALARLEASIDGRIVATEHVRQTKDGVFRHRNAGQEVTPPFCLLKYPIQSGSKWKGEITVGKEKGKYVCEAMQENVEVPAGKYKAMRVAIKLDMNTGMTVQTSYWFVKDVGFVKQTVDAGGLNILMELEKFDAGKKK